MGTISSGVGLISGIDTDNLIKQLMQIEARPRQLVQQRVDKLESQKSAMLDVNSKLLALKGSADTFTDTSSFGTKRATSGKPSVLKASADENASLGTYNFSVSRLVSTHQMITRGFADSDTTTMGQDATIRVESAQARLDRETELADLNGFAGVERGSIRITDRSGNSATVDLARAVTIDDVINEINNASGVSVIASIDGDQLKVADNTGATDQDLVISNVGSQQTATSLGIAGNSGGTDVITGDQINKVAGGTTLDSLNDGHGVRIRGSGLADFQIDDGTSTFNVTLDGASTVQDVIDKINDASGNSSVTASIASDGVSLQLAGDAGITVTAQNSSNAATDLGIEGSGGATVNGDRLLAAMNSKLVRNLSGASGVNFGTVTFDTGSGAQAVDLSGARSFSQVINQINDAGVGVTASLNDAGNGIEVAADNGQSLTIADSTGNLASTLNLAGTHGGGVADAGDLDFAYVNENTRLEDLNRGDGVAAGSFVITDSSGASATVDLSQGETTLGDVIKEINSRPIDVTASINDSGDGILLTDSAGGTLALTVSEDGSTTAKDLGLLGSDEDGDGKLDGSFEKTVEIAADDTLKDVADKLKSADVGLSTTLINDGSGTNPIRLNISSEHGGRSGRVLFDDGGLGLNTSTLTEGRDAVVFFGSADPAEGVLLTSSTNSLTNTIDGVSIDLLSTSTEAVELTISRDTDQIVESVNKFVDDFNTVMETIGQLDSYDQEKQERGILLGDSTLASVRRQLLGAVTSNFDDVSGRYSRLSEVGVRIGSDAKLVIDEAKLREAISTDLNAVTELFTLKTQQAVEDEQISDGVTLPGSGTEVTARGFGATLEQTLDLLTDSISGIVTGATDNFDSQIELANDRIEQLNELLASKRQRLEQEFASMETALAQLQSQQSALASLSGAANSSMGLGL